MPEIGSKRLAARARRLWSLTGEDAVTALAADLVPVWIAQQLDPEDRLAGDESLWVGDDFQIGVAGQFGFVGIQNVQATSAEQQGTIIVVEAAAPVAQVAHIWFYLTTAALNSSISMQPRDTRMFPALGAVPVGAGRVIRGTNVTLGIGGARIWPGDTLTPFRDPSPTGGPFPFILAPGEMLVCWASTAAIQIECGFLTRERLAERYEGRKR